MAFWRGRPVLLNAASVTRVLQASRASWLRAMRSASPPVRGVVRMSWGFVDVGRAHRATRSRMLRAQHPTVNARFAPCFASQAAPTAWV